MARVALALGLDPWTKPLEIIEALSRAMTKPPVSPVVVTKGACQQNVLIGDEADLMEFPTPLIHAGDGGRYFNTLGFWVVRTPDGLWTNWSIARGMIVDGKRMTAGIAPYQHLGMIYKLWRDRGEPMPFALVQGAEPAALFVGGMPLPDRVDEAGYLGGLFGEPLELVRCKTVDLEVPATAEIVVEGHVSLDETAPEGPMGEYHGYQRTRVTVSRSATSARSRIGTTRSSRSRRQGSPLTRITPWPVCRSRRCACNVSARRACR